MSNLFCILAIQQEETNLNESERDSMSNTLDENESNTLTPEAPQQDESEKETCNALLPFPNAEKHCDSLHKVDSSQLAEEQQDTEQAGNSRQNQEILNDDESGKFTHYLIVALTKMNL